MSLKKVSLMFLTMALAQYSSATSLINPASSVENYKTSGSTSPGSIDLAEQAEIYFSLADKNGSDLSWWGKDISGGQPIEPNLKDFFNSKACYDIKVLKMIADALKVPSFRKVAMKEAQKESLYYFTIRNMERAETEMNTLFSFCEPIPEMYGYYKISDQNLERAKEAGRNIGSVMSDE